MRLFVALIFFVVNSVDHAAGEAEGGEKTRDWIHV